MNRNIWILTISQALAFSGVTLVLLVGGLVGVKLAPDPAWATVPNALMIVGAAIFTLPAALLMKRIGRKRGFIASAIATAIGSFVTAYLIAIENFYLFSLAMLLFGSCMAFVQQYRFAAAESVAPDQVSKAVSRVLLGGIAAGFLGPEIGKRFKDWLDYGEYTGPFVIAGFLYLAVALVFLLFRDEARQTAVEGSKSAERPMTEIFAQPVMMTAFGAAAIAYWGMSLIMTATSVSMHVVDGFTVGDTAFVIQSHILGMFVPSLFTGHLIARFGVYRIMIVGIALMIACSLIAMTDQSLLHYWAALVSLGIGWNFLFIGATTLLTQSYRESESFKVQAVNDFLVFAVQAFAALAAGRIIFQASWATLQIIVLPVFSVMFVWLLWSSMRREQDATESG